MGAIYLIRHGQASAGKRDYDQLSPMGIEQAERLGEALRSRIGTPDRVICGDMKRHRQTAHYSLAHMGQGNDWHTDARWNEYDHEDLIVRHKPLYASRTLMLADLARTLKPRIAFQAMFEEALQRWTSGRHDAEYNEAWPAFQQRIVAGLRELIDSGRSQNTLVYTSGGVISTVVQQLWQLPDAEWQKLNRIIANATVTKVVFGNSGSFLSTFNEHSHFEGEHQHLLTYR